MKSFKARTVFVGDSGVGKTCIVNKYLTGEFSDQLAPTIGSDFHVKTFEIKDSIVELEIWDTAGEERYKSVAPIYFRQAAAGVFVFDTANKTTFDNLKNSWIPLFQGNVADDALIFIVENKIDIVDPFMNITDIQKFADDNGYFYFRTSALSGEGINQLFEGIAAQLAEQNERKAKEKQDYASISLQRQQNQPTPRSTCPC